jgi:hypothetical protein
MIARLARAREKESQPLSWLAYNDTYGPSAVQYQGRVHVIDYIQGYYGLTGMVMKSCGYPCTSTTDWTKDTVIDGVDDLSDYTWSSFFAADSRLYRADLTPGVTSDLMTWRWKSSK